MEDSVCLAGGYPRSRCVLHESEASAALHQEENASPSRWHCLQGSYHRPNDSKAGNH